MRLDEERVSSRSGEPTTNVPEPPPVPAAMARASHSEDQPSRPHSRQEDPLESIEEVDENEGEENETEEDATDDEDEPYPLDH